LKTVPSSRSRRPDSYLNPIIDNPFAVFAIALVAQWGAAFVGDLLRRRIRPHKKDEREDFDTVLAAALTLLALGFSFSMAASRYDQRKNHEEAEANKPSPVLALTVSGMNDIFNAQANTRAPWVEPHPNGGAGSHGIDRNLFKSIARLPGSQ
jgi:hypothetical protein